MYLNEFEEEIVKEISSHANGRAWVARPYLVDKFCPSRKRDSPQRKRLDRALKRLVPEVLAKQITRDGGVAYALAETAAEFPHMKEAIRNSELRGKAVVMNIMSPARVTDEQIDTSIQKLEQSGRRLKLYELRAIKRWRERKERPYTGRFKSPLVIVQNGEPISIVDPQA